MYMAVLHPNNRATAMQFQFVYGTGADCTSMYYDNMAHVKRDSMGNLVVPPSQLGGVSISGFQGGASDLYEARAVGVKMADDNVRRHDSLLGLDPGVLSGCFTAWGYS
jgi:hypothetical protein